MDNPEVLEKIQENEDALEKPKPTKRQQTEAQKANTEKMRLALKAKHEASRIAKEQLATEKLAKAEARVLKKAEAIKKREKKELKIIDAIPSESDESSEEDEPVVVTPPPKKRTKKIYAPPPSESEESSDDEPPPPKLQRYIPQRPIVRYV